jgi:DNA-binding XRE family transcriptional regulator
MIEIERAEKSRQDYLRRNSWEAILMKYRDLLNEMMLDPEFRTARKELEGEYQAMRAVYVARSEQGLTQKELAAAAKVPQKTISLIETGNSNTTVNTLAKLARACGNTLKIEFV